MLRNRAEHDAVNDRSGKRGRSPVFHRRTGDVWGREKPGAQRRPSTTGAMSDWRPQAPFRRPTAAQAAALGPEMGVPPAFIAGQAMFGGREKPGAKRAYPRQPIEKRRRRFPAGVMSGRRQGPRGRDPWKGGARIAQSHAGRSLPADYVYPCRWPTAGRIKI